MADQTITFASWVRDPLSKFAEIPSGGRMTAAVPVTVVAISPEGATETSADRSVRFELAGPGDIAGLTPQAIVRRYPPPDALDHESDRCPYVELADPALLWRYTPAPTPDATLANLHPWLVLFVGEEPSELEVNEGSVTIAPAAQGGPQAIGAPASPYRFAHVQTDAAGRATARLLSARPLKAGTDYVAALVPAFDAAGQPSWTGAAPAIVPVYDLWRFRTAVPAGSFEELAAQLRPGKAPATLGRAPILYPRVPETPALDLAGALVAVEASTPPPEPPLPQTIADDLAALQEVSRDAEGRPIVTLPRYGEAWNRKAPDESPWGQALNRDPRNRAAAGLGLEIAIRCQQELVGDAVAHLGALKEARQRVRHAALGLAASRALWKRRVPTEPEERLWLLGPALRRMMTSTGSLAERASAADRALPTGIFSAAARRALRRGPARTALAASLPRAGAILAAANREPPPPPDTHDGLPLDDSELAQFRIKLRDTVNAGQIDPQRLMAAAAHAGADADDRVRPNVDALVSTIATASAAGRAVPWSIALSAIAEADTTELARAADEPDHVEWVRRRVSDVRENIDAQADGAELLQLLKDMALLDPGDPKIASVDLAALSAGAVAAVDPTHARPALVERVLGTITTKQGDDAPPLAPPEPCARLDRAAGTDLAREFKEWMLPGIAGLGPNSVLSLETNPEFIEAFLAGLNTQLLTELRWRNIPVATGCTPIRRFWDRADPLTGEPVDDIIGLHNWSLDSELGAASHRAAAGAGKDLVILIKGRLFQRYPTTLLTLVSAVHGTSATPDFHADPADDAARLLPGFQGRLGEDIRFFGFPGVEGTAVARHWIVLEEPPAGYRFANDLPINAQSGQAWAAAAVVEPVRVLIRGDALFAGGAG